MIVGMPAILALWKTGIRKITACGDADDLRWRDLPTEYRGKGQIRLKVANETRM